MIGSETGSIRSLGLADLDRAVFIQSKAFHNDPLWKYLIMDPEKRGMLLPKFNQVFLNIGIRNGQTYGVSDPIEGVAVWGAPYQNEIAFSGFATMGFFRLFGSPLFVAFAKALRIFSQAEAMHKKYARDPHYYLNTIAVLPESQGRGLASRLIRPFLEEADERSMGAYTETMRASNVELYEHYGFQCMEEYCVPRTDLTIWALYRTPNR
jgi:ribosomal protein S18 acetylase RimI-like enzyme